MVNWQQKQFSCLQWLDTMGVIKGSYSELTVAEYSSQYCDSNNRVLPLIVYHVRYTQNVTTVRAGGCWN